jgi:deazaflavin-dependent oxidoreductase (nitroreductase family)
MRLTSRLTNLSTRTPRLQSRATRAHARLYRRTGGRRGGRWINGAPVLVIETVGRRSGRPRATPVVYARDGERFVVTAANAGARRPPAWWLNLREAGTATIQVGDRELRVRAEAAQGAERERLWGVLREVVPAIDDYVAFTDREFPIVVLEPAARTGDAGP